MAEGINTRDLVLSMLIEINENGQYSHLLLRQVLEKYQYLDRQERAFITRLTEGTLERLLELDFIIDAFSKTKVRKMKPLIRNLLRMSAYQLKYMDAIPDSAVCNEAVKLAKKHGFGPLSGFVNGVLRNMARQLETVAYPDPKKNLYAYLSVTYSMPEWILKKWIADYGKEKTMEILTAFSGEYPLTIRTNTTQITPEALKQKLEAEGVSVSPVEGLSYAFAIEGFDYLNALESFAAGDFYVQDVSSMMVAEAADPQKGDFIIDVCAAPGGKASHLAEKLEGSGMVEARDLTDYKVGLIEENILRHGLTNMKACRRDALVRDEASVEKADIVICDLPCSGLGVMGKKTDLRYKTSLQKTEELADLQRRMLDTCAAYVRRGGKLIYSTCTINRAENEENVSWFLKAHPEFGLIMQRQIFPGEAGSDGFFLARLEKSGE